MGNALGKGTPSFILTLPRMLTFSSQSAMLAPIISFPKVISRRFESPSYWCTGDKSFPCQGGQPSQLFSSGNRTEEKKLL